MERPWSKRYTLTILSFLVICITVYGDGCYFARIAEKDTWVPSIQKEQVGIIKYTNGTEELSIIINSNTQGKQGVWIFPVPAKPQDIKIDIIEDLPSFKGEDVKAKAGIKLDDSFELALFYYYLPVLGPFMYIASGYGGGLYRSPQIAQDIKVFTHIEKMGLTTELISAENGNAIKEYLKKKNLNLPENFTGLLNEYVNKKYSFVVSWINNISEYKATNKVLAVKCVFPTDKIYYPLKLTSLYGNTSIPIKIYVHGFVTPIIYKDIETSTSVGYFIDTDKELQYTRILINTNAHNLTEDLWIENSPPLDIALAGFIIYHPTGFIILLMLTVSVTLSVLLGILVFKKEQSLKKLVLAGATNLLMFPTFILLAPFILEKKRQFTNAVIMGLFFLVTLSFLFVLVFVLWNVPYTRIIQPVFLLLVLVSPIILLIILSRIAPNYDKKMRVYFVLFTILFPLIFFGLYSSIKSHYPYAIIGSIFPQLCENAKEKCSYTKAANAYSKDHYSACTLICKPCYELDKGILKGSGKKISHPWEEVIFMNDTQLSRYIINNPEYSNYGACLASEPYGW